MFSGKTIPELPPPARWGLLAGLGINHRHPGQGSGRAGAASAGPEQREAWAGRERGGGLNHQYLGPATARAGAVSAGLGQPEARPGRQRGGLMVGVLGGVGPGWSRLD